jgi:FKBP-type peptidyl-prolyl cis-trans isomerase FklB
MAVVVTGMVLTGVALAYDGKAPKTEKEKLSYTIGHQIGQGLKQDGFDIDPAVVGQAIGDVMKGAKPALTVADMQAVLMASREKRLQARKALADKNLKAGQEFLAANKSKKDVVTLPSGLQYKVVKAGAGDKPRPEDTVTVHYHGTLIGGTVFDSSVARGQPATFPVKGVIKGWQEVLPLMPTGSKWQVVIPAELAYGPNGAPGGKIGPNEVLIFDIELIGIKK